MPIIRPNGRTSPQATLIENLVDRLVKELLGEPSRDGPVVFEMATDRPQVVDVIACWPAWKDVPDEARSKVVREAYGRFEKVLESGLHHVDPERPRQRLVPTPATVSGITWEDLARADLLPYRVVPHGNPDPEDLRLLMREVGAIQTPNGPQLRFPNREMAAEAVAKLVQEMPEVRWEIAEPDTDDAMPILSFGQMD